MKIKPKSQKEIDARAIAEHKAVGADNPGGQDKIGPPRSSWSRKGIKVHDQGPDTWGMNRTPRYERD